MNGNNNLQMYQNSGYINTRNRKRTLLLDVDDESSEVTHLGSGGEFNIPLFEPLIIDKHSEIYLDNFLTYNSNTAATINQAAFCLKINEFNMNSNVASSTNNNDIYNSLVIPNDHKTVANNHGVVIHKGKKFNYVCDINPQTIHSLSGKITDLNSVPMFHGLATTRNFTYTIVGIDSDKLSRLILSGEQFTSITNAAGTTSAGEFLTTHFNDSNEIHFATDTDILAIESGGGGTIVFNGVTLNGTSRDDVEIDNAVASDNPNLHLLSNPARFIAEFSIISRD